MAEETNVGIWKSPQGILVEFSDKGVSIPHDFFTHGASIVEAALVEMRQAHSRWSNHYYFADIARIFADDSEEYLYEVFQTMDDNLLESTYKAWYWGSEWVTPFEPEVEKVGRAVQRAYFWRNMPKQPGGGYVYVVRSVTGHYKIGRTKNPDNRMKTFGIQLPFEVEYHAVYPTATMREDEKFLHEHFAEKRVNGEWFNLDEGDLSFIEGYASAS